MVIMVMAVPNLFMSSTCVEQKVCGHLMSQEGRLSRCFMALSHNTWWCANCVCVNESIFCNAIYAYTLTLSAFIAGVIVDCFSRLLLAGFFLLAASLLG